MKFSLKWTPKAREAFDDLKSEAKTAAISRNRSGRSKSSKQEGLLKQVCKCVKLLEQDPKHPGLNTHEFSSLSHPYRKGEKVFEATPSAYRVFWCYGPGKGEITIIAITSHP